MRRRRRSLAVLAHWGGWLPRHALELTFSALTLPPASPPVGTAGAPLAAGDFSDELGPWGVKQLTAWGYTRLFASDISLRLQFVLNADGRVGDEVVIPRWAAQKGAVGESPLPAPLPSAEIIAEANNRGRRGGPGHSAHEEEEEEEEERRQDDAEDQEPF